MGSQAEAPKELISRATQRGRGMPSGILRKTELIARLDELEQIFRSTGETDVQKLRDLQPSIRYWADRTSHLAQLNRFAGLLKRAGDPAAALALLQFAHSISPGHGRSAAALCDLLVASGRVTEALQVICPHVCTPDAEVQVLSSAARVYHRVGDWERGNQLYERAVQKDPARSGEFLDALTKSGCKERGLSEAERILASRPEDPKLCFSCFAAFLKLGAGSAKLGEARGWLFECAARAPNGAIWRARTLRLEGELDAALGELTQRPASPDDDAAIVRERAVFALANGYWGRDAKLLLAARPTADATLAENIGQADLLLRACGSSLEQAAADPASACHVSTPESVFELVSATSPPRATAGERNGLVMIVPSLAGGGAERIVASSFRSWAKDPRFGWAKLYVSDLDRDAQADFYLPLTGIQRSDIVILENEQRLDPPWVWLGRARGQRAQCIHRHLLEHRPAIVHATLDLLNSGLAAVAAGVPRIVLHLHNMRPSELGARDTDRMRECYRTLLRRPEVKVVGCAQACIDDHLEWLGVADTGNFHTVHNGLDVETIIASGDPESSAAQRAALGFAPENLVVGTAIRFAELKRPFLWVDVAARVLSKLPDCKFVMFGDGELRDGVRRYIAERKLSSSIILPGRVRDIHRRLSILDLFVLSSRTEALPNALLEAQAAGVPVIAFDVGGVGEAMIEGVTGWLVREQTPDALASRVLAALEMDEWRCEAGAAAQAFVRRNFSMDRMINSLSSILLQTGPSDSSKNAEAALTT